MFRPGIAQVSKEAKIELDEEEYIGKFKPFMMDVVFEWCKGAKFSQICKMTELFEGTHTLTYVHNGLHFPKGGKLFYQKMLLPKMSGVWRGLVQINKYIYVFFRECNPFNEALRRINETNGTSLKKYREHRSGEQVFGGNQIA